MTDTAYSLYAKVFCIRRKTERKNETREDEKIMEKHDRKNEKGTNACIVERKKERERTVKVFT